MRLTYFILAASFALISLYAKKKSNDKLFDAYHNNDSYGQGMDYKRSKDYILLIKLSVTLSLFCLVLSALS